MKRLILAGIAALGIAACQTTESEPDIDTVATTTQSEAPAAATADWARADFDDMSNWLCHPGKTDDACDQDQTYTQVNMDGSTEVKPFAAAAEPEIDCFYIYPTVSYDPGSNSDLTPGPEEISVINNQFARFSSVCRTFAPMYRQITLTELRKSMAGGKFSANMEMRWADVMDSWNNYLENDNDGRGVILVGHSQGSGIIAEMLAKEIVGSPAEDLIISAMPIGITIPVDASGKAAGLPLCRQKGQTGCLITFASFRSTSPPPAISRFGRTDAEGQPAACVNPALLSGDAGVLDARLSTAPFASSGQSPEFGADVSTPFASVPGLLTGMCRSNQTHTWLEVRVNANPADPRTDDIAGDVVANGQILTDWGLHLVDMNVSMGNLIRIAEVQSSAWTSRED